MEAQEDIFRRIRLVCPGCGQGNLEAVSEHAVRCAACDAEYPRTGNLVDLMPGRQPSRSIPQCFMESGLIITIYDSLLWRRNPLLQMFMGLTFGEESGMIQRAIHPEAGGVVLDLACGTGIYGRRIASRFPGSFIVGLDLSLPMLGYARMRFEEQGCRDYLLIHGNAQALPMEDGSVDAALCGGALHLFPDIGAALREAGRVVRPGGGFAAAAYCRRESLLSLAVEQVAGFLGGIHGYSLAEYRQMMREAEFERVTLLHEGPLWAVLSGVRE